MGSLPQTSSPCHPHVTTQAGSPTIHLPPSRVRKLLIAKAIPWTTPSTVTFFLNVRWDENRIRFNSHTISRCLHQGKMYTSWAMYTRQKWARWAQTHPPVFSFILKGGTQHLIKTPGSNTIMLVTAKPKSKTQWVLWTLHHWLPPWAILGWWWLSSSLVGKGFYSRHADLFLQCKNIYFNHISQKEH